MGRYRGKYLQVYFPESKLPLLNILKEYCRKHGVSISSLIRNIVKQLITTNEIIEILNNIIKELEKCIPPKGRLDVFLRLHYCLDELRKLKKLMKEDKHAVPRGQHVLR